MSTAETKNSGIADAIAAERRDLAVILAGLPPEAWDAPTLCQGWRVREVVAHITMPFRYRPPRFAFEMVRSRGNFNRMADRCARRDGTAPPAELAAALRDNERNPWKPPGGGFEGALTHDVIHGLDITVALGLDRRVPEDRLRTVLAAVTGPKSRKFLGPTWPGSPCTPRTWTGRSGRGCRYPARPRTSRSSCAAARSRPGICAVSPVPGSPG